MATSRWYAEGTFRRYQDEGRGFGIGSDSHISVGVAEELRWYEYGQRLRDERRNRLAGGPGRSVGCTLYDGALHGGAQVLGQGLGAIAPGAVASFLVLDDRNALIAGRGGETSSTAGCSPSATGPSGT